MIFSILVAVHKRCGRGHVLNCYVKLSLKRRRKSRRIEDGEEEI